MKQVYFILCAIFILACKKDESSPSPIVSYNGVYVGDLTESNTRLGVTKDKPLISNGRVTITPLGADGKVIIAVDKILSDTLSGKITGTSLVFGPKDMYVTSLSKSNVSGKATFSGDSMSIEITRSNFIMDSGFKLFDLDSFKGTMTKQ